MSVMVSGTQPYENRFDLNESLEGFCWTGRGRSFHVEGPKTEKGQEPAVEIKSGVRNLEAESIRSGVESTRGCVKLKTVTELRRSSACDTFIAKCLYLVLNCFAGTGANGDIETEE